MRNNLTNSFFSLPTDLPNVDPNWYSMLTRNLKPEDAKSLQEILVLAEQKKAAKRSKEIENSGGNLHDRNIQQVSRI